MGIDDRRHDGLAAQIDERRADGRLDLTLLADADDAVVLDEERGVLDWRAAVAGDETRAFEERDVGRGLTLFSGRCRRRTGRNTNKDD